MCVWGGGGGSQFLRINITLILQILCQIETEKRAIAYALS